MRSTRSLPGATVVLGCALLALAAAPVTASTSAGGRAAWLSVSGSALPDPYPQFLFGGRTRVNPREFTLGPQNASRLTTFWTHGGPSGAAGYGAPVVADGKVFEGWYQCCPRPSSVQAIDAKTGKLIWTFPTPALVVAPAAVAGGTVFAGDYNGTLYAIAEKTGTLLWSGQAGGQFFDNEGLTVGDGVVYATTTTLNGAGGTLSAWTASGCGAVTCSPLWTATAYGPASSVAAVGDTEVYVVDGQGYVDAFPVAGCSASPCTALWRGQILPPGRSFSSLSVVDGIVYAEGSELYAFPAYGCGAVLCAPLWQYLTGGSDIGVVSVAYNHVYVGTGAGLTAFPDRCLRGSTCGALWVDPTFSTARLIVANGVVYGATAYAPTTSVFAADAFTGHVLFRQALQGAGTIRAPAIANGVLYVATTVTNEVIAYHLGT
jgi:outer membrane protein assembly factor BamB